MLKKMMLLAMAVGALVAFAVPASASASEWKMEGEAIETEETVEFTGPATFAVPGPIVGSTITCTIHALAHLEPGSTAKVTLTVTATNNSASGCELGGEIAAVCTDVAAAHVLNTQPGGYYVAHDEGTSITITGVAILNTLTDNGSGKCPTEVGGGPGTITATPDNTSAIHTVSLSGTLPITETLSASVSGVLNATPSGTYGL